MNIQHQSKIVDPTDWVKQLIACCLWWAALGSHPFPPVGVEQESAVESEQLRWWIDPAMGHFLVLP